jgi:transcription antitermination factor NusG
MELADDENQVFLKEDGRKWYVIYTRSRAEKKTGVELHELGIESYVPLQKKLHQWKDRRKFVEEPLIRSYVFVKLKPQERDRVFQCTHVIRYISFEGKPAEVPEKQILELQQFIGADIPLEATMDRFRPGETVKIIHGPLTGISGELVSVDSSRKFLLRIDKIGYSLLASIPAAWVEKDL